MIPYEISICSNEDGTLKEGYTIETLGSDPRLIKSEDWPSIVAGSYMEAIRIA